MKAFNKISLIGLGLLAVSITGPFAHANNQAASAVATLTGAYDEQVKLPDPDTATGGDLQIHCMSIVYAEWARAYLTILENSAIDLPVPAPLDVFANLWFRVQQDLAVAEFFRPGLAKSLRDNIAKLRAKNGVADLDTTKMTVTDVQGPLYMSNLDLCDSREIIDWTLPHVGKPDPTKKVPTNLIHPAGDTVKWTATAAGGVTPALVDGSPAPSALREFSEPTGLTYPEYVNRIQNRN